MYPNITMPIQISNQMERSEQVGATIYLDSNIS